MLLNVIGMGVSLIAGLDMEWSDYSVHSYVWLTSLTGTVQSSLSYLLSWRIPYAICRDDPEKKWQPH